MTQQYGPPTSPPPPFIPPKPLTSYIMVYMHQYTYVWSKQGRPFWFYPTRVEYGEVSGYRWNGSYWLYYGLDPGSIDAVACQPTPTLY